MEEDFELLRRMADPGHNRRFPRPQFISTDSVVASNGQYVTEAWKTYLIFFAVMTFSSASSIFRHQTLIWFCTGKFGA
ncbi:uncharacterized protein FRV6_08561 [Fusarium oxysporum]|uniref:Uncharacterized protein n=1 Tax=Fusarium oxysporum TaxID=5507 RepID=A0A2H3T6U4_FUSOX|nr:uncharacterized protein FRV6_08561 [Fusarium oxysporum]